MPAATDSRPSARRKRRRSGAALGLLVLVLLLAAGYVRIKPVLIDYALMHTIQANDLMAARAAIGHGAKVNARIVNDETEGLMDALAGRRLDDFYEPTSMLSIAAEAGRADMVQLLVSRGAEVNVRSGENWTPLMFAASSGNIDSVRCLVSYGADVNAVTGDDGTPVLSFAGKRPEIRLLLIRAGARGAGLQSTR